MKLQSASTLLLVLFGAEVQFAVADESEGRASVSIASALNAPPPKGAVILFDGHNLDAWAKQKNREWETSDGPAKWKILSDHSLEVVPGAGSIITKKKFGDCQLHIEFRLVKQQTNGGIFLLARYELAIRDSTNDSKSDCGIFENLKEPIYPIEKASLPRNQWQAFDITFHAPRLDAKGQVVRKPHATVLLNGIKTHDDVELGARKGASKRLQEATKGPIMLQEHGTPYQFRNIWLVDQSSHDDRAATQSAAGAQKPSEER